MHAAALRSEAGAYAISGVWPYDLHGQGELGVPGLPPVNFAFAAALSPERIQFTTATLSGRNASTGRVNFTGQAQWLPHPGWTAAGTATEINPAAFASVASGRLTFGFQGSGDGFHATDAFSVQLQNLSGVMHNLPARGSGPYRAHWRGLEAGCDPRPAGGHQPRVGWHAQRSRRSEFEVRSPDLSLLVARPARPYRRQREIHGVWRDPSVKATFSAGALQFQGLALNDLSARMDFDPQRKGPAFVDVHARGLTLGTRTADDLRLKLDGEERNHDLDLNIAAP